MKIQQLSLFLENKPGRLVEPCRLLARAGVNIHTLSLADTAHYGILRMIVSDWTKAAELFRGAGYAFTTTRDWLARLDIASLPLYPARTA